MTPLNDLLKAWPAPNPAKPGKVLAQLAAEGKGSQMMVQLGIETKLSELAKLAAEHTCRDGRGMWKSFVVVTLWTGTPCVIKIPAATPENPMEEGRLNEDRLERIFG
jgi:hypothetical protein